MNSIHDSPNHEMPASIPGRLRRNRGLISREQALLLLVVMAVVFLGALTWYYRRFLLSGLDLVAELTGSRTTALAALGLSLLAIAWILFWMLFPIFVYFGLRDLRRRTAELSLITQRCAQDLAQLTESSRGAISSPSIRDQPPDAQPD